MPPDSYQYYLIFRQPSGQRIDWDEPTGGLDDDHVARFRVRDLPEAPDRIDAVTAEIAMGRSVLEG